MKLVLFLLAFIALSHALQGGNPGNVVAGTATVQYDFTHFSNDIQVSVCDQATFDNQGGAVRTYTVNTTNFINGCTFSIVEGGHARFQQSFPLSNGIVVVATNYSATLSVHLEQYHPEEVGNTFCVRFRTTDALLGSQPQVFRVYCATGNGNILPLSNLFDGRPYPAPANVVYRAWVLRTSQAVTVFAGEQHLAVQDAVWVIGHSAEGLITDTNCADGTCDSGRLIAVVEVPLLCIEPTVNVWPNTDITFSWLPSPVAYPVATDFRRYPQLPQGNYNYYLLAVDNYNIRAENTVGAPGLSKTVAAACYNGTCEAVPITSVLTVSVPGLNGTLHLSVNGVPEFGPFPITGSVKYCVYNLQWTEVAVTFPGPVVVENRHVDCEIVTQLCNAGVFTTLACPDFGCLADGGPMGPTYPVTVDVTVPGGISIYHTVGPAQDVLRCIRIPAVPFATVEVIETGPGKVCPTLGSCLACAQAPATRQTCQVPLGICLNDTLCQACAFEAFAGVFPPQNPLCLTNALFQAAIGCVASQCPTCGAILAPSGCARYSLNVYGCDGVPALKRSEARSVIPTFSGNPPAQCTTLPQDGNYGRMLSAFEIFFLSRPVTVDITTSDGMSYRHYVDQGEVPRMYCVLPVVLRVMIQEGSDMWASFDESCVLDLPGQSDCSICDFLTILKFDLTGIPRPANGQLSADTPAVPFRDLFFIGGQLNKISALRSGAGSLPPKQTCVLVDDNGARKTICNVCSMKDCWFRNFTYDLCLDLSNPLGTTPGKGVDRLLTVRLAVPGGAVFRTLTSQGGVNGITNQGARSLDEDAVVQGSSSMLLHETRAAPENYTPIVPCYKVLMGTWNVVVSEFTNTLPPRTVNCMTQPTCNAKDFIALLSVNTQCGAGRAGAPFLPTGGFDITLLDSNGVQFRGPRARAILANCTYGDFKWSGPTCCDVGNMELFIATLRTEIQVLAENQKFGLGACGNRTGGYPNPSQHPTVNVPADCRAPSCATNRNTMFSTLVIASQRGLPNATSPTSPGPQYAALKFGDNQQNVIRIVGNNLLVAPSPNQWCVVADPRPWYAINWESWASDGPNRPFANCASRTPTSQDVCQVGAGFVITVPPMQK